MSAIKNPFRRADNRKMFDACVETFEAGGFRNNDGTQNRGGSHKVSFWNGYNGVADHYTVPGSLGWACRRAGQACRKLADSRGDDLIPDKRAI